MNRGSISDVVPILENYPADCWPHECKSVGSCGGLSGALFWRLSAPRGELCLRRWPSVHPSRERLAWIHQVLREAAPRCSFSLPLPIETVKGESFVEAPGHFWELTEWLDGVPASAGDAETLGRAMAAVAELHIAFAAAGATNGTDAGRPRMGAPPGIAKRLAVVSSLDLSVLQSPARQFDHNSACLAAVVDLLRIFSQVGDRLARDVKHQLSAASRLTVPLQVCVRDIWTPHVLFLNRTGSGATVSGIVDFGAMDVDTVACDVARLLGSLAGNDADAWRGGMAAYEAIRPLSEEECTLVAAYDRSGVLLSAANWLRWLLAEGRSFPDEVAVEGRLVELATRLWGLS